MTYISRSVTLMMKRGGEFTRTGQYSYILKVHDHLTFKEKTSPEAVGSKQ